MTVSVNSFFFCFVNVSIILYFYNKHILCQQFLKAKDKPLYLCFVDEYFYFLTTSVNFTNNFEVNIQNCPGNAFDKITIEMENGDTTKMILTVS